PGPSGEKSPGGPRVLDDRRERLEDLVADLAVGREVVFAAQPVVPDPGRLGYPGVELERLLVARDGRPVGHGAHFSCDRLWAVLSRNLASRRRCCDVN